jgi:hypothetical protein
MKRKNFTIFALLIFLLAIGVVIYTQFYFVFGVGVKTGTLNQIVYKGYMFKTYEGRLILDGVYSQQAGMLQSNAFDFSVVKKSVADRLMTVDNAAVRLHYSEYKHTLPWRGNSKYVVDSIVILK